MRQQNVIILSSGKNKRVAHEIAQGLDDGVCRAVVWDAKEIDLFRHTLTQFLLPGMNGTYHVNAFGVESCANKIFIDEIDFDESTAKQPLPWLFGRGYRTHIGL